jgi:hypothetical protein
MKSVKVSQREHKHLRPRAANLGESGQAAVEYLLILVVGVALVSLLAQVYKPFGDFATAYFSNYLECLLETGELPGSQTGICIQEYSASVAKFSSASKSGLASAGAGSASSSANAAASASGGKGGASAKPGNASAEGSNSMSSRFGAGGASTAGIGSLKSRNPEAADSKKEESYTGSSAVSSGRFAGYGNNAQGRRRVQRMDGSFQIFDDRQPLATVSSDNKSVIRRPADATDALRPVRARDNFNLRPKKSAQPDVGFSIGFAFRFLLIAAIIIAIILLIGGQAMQISRGSE